MNTCHYSLVEAARVDVDRLRVAHYYAVSVNVADFRVGAGYVLFRPGCGVVENLAG